MSTQLSILHGGAVGPLVGGMQKVGLPTDHVDGFIRFGLPSCRSTASLTLQAICVSLQASFWRDRPISRAVTGR